MATIEDAGAARPTGIQVRIIEGRPFVTDFPFRLKSGAAWPSAPVLAFAGPSGTIQWPSTLSDGGKLATVTATKAEVDTLLDHSLRGSVELNDPSTGRMWASGSYFTVLANWTGGTNPAALADGAVVVDDRLVIMGTGDGSGTITSIAWTEVTGKPSSYPPSPHSHGDADLSGVVKTVNGTAPDGAGDVTVSGGGSAPAGGGVTVTDAPAKPTDGQSASYLVSSGVVWPSGLVWSSDPDGGVAPAIAGVALVSMFTVGTVTRAILSASWASEAATDETPPVAGTLVSSDVGHMGFTVSASGASDTGGLSPAPYAFRLDSGAWSGWQASQGYTFSGLSADTAYQAQHKVRDAVGNEALGAAITVTTSAAPAPTGYAGAIMALSPAGYWKLDETSGAQAVDSSGNGRHGTYSGPVTHAGQNGYASFGTGALVTIPDADPFSAIGGLAIVALVRASTWNSADRIMEKAGSGFEWRISIPGTDVGPGSKNTRMQIYAPNGDDTPASTNTTTAPSISPGAWHLLVWSVANPATQSVSIWVDGVEATFDYWTPSGPSTSNTASPVKIGAGGNALGHVALIPGGVSSAQVATLVSAASAEGLIA